MNSTPPTHSGGIYSVRKIRPSCLSLFCGDKETSVRAIIFAGRSQENEATRLLMSTLCDALNQGPRMRAALEESRLALESIRDTAIAMDDAVRSHLNLTVIGAEGPRRIKETANAVWPKLRALLAPDETKGDDA